MNCSWNSFGDSSILRDDHISKLSASIGAVGVAMSNDPSLVDRFRDSMRIGQAEWRDGESYDLALLLSASLEDAYAIAVMLIPPRGWRDIEALASLNVDAARDALRAAKESGSIDVQLAMARYAPTFLSDEERSAILVRALQLDELSGDLSLALDQVADFHPPAVVDALFRGLFERPGDVACNFAAMLAFVFEKADSSFDWAFRPLFLRFNTDLHAERVDALGELCALIGLDAAPLMASIGVVASPSV